jgi:hypothetical protein
MYIRRTSKRVKGKTYHNYLLVASVSTLSNDVKHTFVVRGKTGANNTAVLSLAGDPSDPAAAAIKIKTTITPLEGGWARIESFAGRGYGQAVGW